MGKLETLMKTEIVRLARKEIRPLVTPLQRQVRLLNRQIRELVAANKRLTRATKKLEAGRMDRVGELSVPDSEMQSVRMSGGLIKKLRKGLGVTQQQLAQLINISAAAVQSWEQGIARPSLDNKKSLVALRTLGRRDVAKMLTDKGIGKPGRKPRATTKKAKKVKRAKKAKKAKKAPARKVGRPKGKKATRRKAKKGSGRGK